jgi:type VI secretion system protein ImpM
MTLRFGTFGKIPSLGDFFRAELPAVFVDAWDRWLQEGMLAARGALGARWQDAYFGAPLWRFTLAPGLAGPAAMTGVMMMSVDRVGRQFPLTLAAALPDGADLALHHLGAEAVFDALEAAALEALDDRSTRDALLARLAAVPDPAAPAAAQRRRSGTGEATVAPGDGLLALAARGLAGELRRPSFWTAALAEETRTLAVDGLPAGEGLIALFDLHARLWTGEDPATRGFRVADPLPEAGPEGTPPPAAVAPDAPTAAAIAAATAMAAAPVWDDPLADILGGDDPEPDAAEAAPGDDPLDAILAAGDAPADAAPAGEGA